MLVLIVPIPGHASILLFYHTTTDPFVVWH